MIVYAVKCMTFWHDEEDHIIRVFSNRDVAFKYASALQVKAETTLSRFSKTYPDKYTVDEWEVHAE